jgi:2-methylaconitate cis-trans-isomerase PrpF
LCLRCDLLSSVNTGAIIHSTFTVHGKLPVEYGTTLIDGVQPAGSPVKLDFLDPAGAMTGTLLPTGNVVDTFTVRGMEYEVSCVDSANPFVFIAASGLGLTGAETGDALLDKTEVLMDIRAQASMRMGLTTDMTEARAKMGTPKIAIVSSSISYVTASGRNISGEDIHISVRPFSMGLPHPTLQMTGAICIASACAIPGTVTNRCVKARLPDEPLIIGHGGGMLATSSSICLDPSTGKVEVKSGSVFRTARRLMKGQVMYLTR